MRAVKGAWRRGWDSNPRSLATQRFSRAPPSTARPPLQRAQDSAARRRPHRAPAQGRARPVRALRAPASATEPPVQQALEVEDRGVARRDQHHRDLVGQLLDVLVLEDLVRQRRGERPVGRRLAVGQGDRRGRLALGQLDVRVRLALRLGDRLVGLDLLLGEDLLLGLDLLLGDLLGLDRGLELVAEGDVGDVDVVDDDVVLGEVGRQRLLGLRADLVAGAEDLVDLVRRDDGLDEVVEGRDR